MRNNMLCQKCKQPVIVPEGKDFVLCCNEVIYVINETHNSKNEGETDDSGRQQEVCKS